MNATETGFVTFFNTIAKGVHKTATDKGWWKERNSLVEAARAHGGDELAYFAQGVLKASMTALEHSELSESLEGVRKSSGEPDDAGDWVDNPLPDDKIPEYTMEEAELADTIIRIMDKSAKYNLRVAEALVAKIQMNKTREYKHGGKSL